MTNSTSRRSSADDSTRPTSTMHHHWPRSDGAVVEVAITTTSNGDFHIDSPRPALDERRASVLDGAWAVVRQVHGADVVEADPTQIREADGVYTDVPGQVIAVQGADCAPIGFVTTAGPIGVVHAGWRGLAAGVIDTMAQTLLQRGASIERVVVGPTIGSQCYEFGASDLDRVVDALGEQVRGTTAQGTPALDLAAGIRVAVERLGLGPVDFLGGCTACAYDGYSYRARGEAERHALAMRIIAPDDAGSVGVASRD